MSFAREAPIRRARTARERQALERRELVGMVVAGHRRVRGGRPQVLADRQDRHPGAPQVVEHDDDLVDLFAESDHDARLGRDGGLYCRDRSSSSSERAYLPPDRAIR